jgi:SIR2-like protein
MRLGTLSTKVLWAEKPPRPACRRAPIVAPLVRGSPPRGFVATSAYRDQSARLNGRRTIVHELYPQRVNDSLEDRHSLFPEPKHGSKQGMNSIELPTALVSSVREGKVILFLGSGAAKGAFHPTGASAPTGPELARRLAEKFLGSEYKDHPLAQVAELSMSEHSSTAVQDFVAEQFRLFDPAPFHRKIAHLPWRAIATTNYDLIVERAYEGGDTVQDLVPFIRDGQRIDDRLTTRKSLQYLKLHGCIKLTADPAIPLILTPEQYITHRRGRARLFDRLKELAYECPLFFIGHSLADSDIRAILLELDEQGDARPRSYVAVPSLKPVEERFWA